MLNRYISFSPFFSGKSLLYSLPIDGKGGLICIFICIMRILSQKSRQRTCICVAGLYAWWTSVCSLYIKCVGGLYAWWTDVCSLYGKEDVSIQEIILHARLTSIRSLRVARTSDKRGQLTYNIYIFVITYLYYPDSLSDLLVAETTEGMHMISFMTQDLFHESLYTKHIMKLG